ncbi:hypothetical protein BpHYR1_015418 [Brachionus plicatilis]|uniref:Uncharacterized protein n=1 Tax=Brachionus plicatilis TaxID=10195 RepID=A0A3M7R2P5_BRAPC|nr:hypothetical protein BpHYR1_015418 [Brachionus plicatilis]
MINFFHQPCCPDGDKAASVAKGMKRKFLQNIFIETDENDLPYVPKRIRNNRRIVYKDPTIEENNPFLSNENNN